MKRSEALKLLTVLQANFRAIPPTQATIEMYAKNLERYRADDGTRAVERMVNEVVEPMFPTWATIRRYVLSVSEAREMAERHELEEREDADFPPEVRRENLRQVAELVRGVLRLVDVSASG